MNDPNSLSPFLKRVRLAFDDLLQRGVLTESSNLYDEKAFGNSEVVLAGKNFQVRLISDRGDELADVCSMPSIDWRPLECVLRAVGVANAPVLGLLSVEQTAELIQEHISVLETGLSPGSLAETERALAKLDADAERQAEERWGPKREVAMHPDTKKYNEAQALADRGICQLLAEQIDLHLPEAENKIWHAHPVWFLDGNPVVGYSKLKDCVRLLFWSGQSFEEEGLKKEGSFKAAEARYTAAEQVDIKKLERWLANARDIQWDYKNLVRRKGRLERLK